MVAGRGWWILTRFGWRRPVGGSHGCSWGGVGCRGETWEPGEQAVQVVKLALACSEPGGEGAG